MSVEQRVWAMSVADTLFPLVALVCRAVMGATVEEHGEYGPTTHTSRRYFVLRCAAMAGSTRCIDWILRKLLPTRNNREECVTVLKGLCAGGHIRLAKALVESGDTPWRVGELRWPVYDTELIKRLRDINTPRSHSLLYDTCEGGHLEAVKWVISKFFGVDTDEMELAMPSFVAARKGHTDVVKLLFDVATCRKDWYHFRCTNQSAIPITIFIGGFAAGKSRLLSTIFRVPPGMTSPIRYGRGGLTTTCEWHTDMYGSMYVDTPALGVERPQQQQAVLEALNRGGTFRVVFVVSLVAERVRPGDVAMMYLLHKVVPTIGSGYSIVINKVSAAVMGASISIKKAIQNQLLGDFPPTSYFYFFPGQSWDSNLTEDFRNFIQHAPAAAIPGGSISFSLQDERQSPVHATESTLSTEQTSQPMTEQLFQEQEPTIQRDAAEYIRSVYHWEAEPFCATGHTERRHVSFSYTASICGLILHSQRATELTQEFKQEPHNGNQRTETLRFNIPSNGPVTGYSCTTARQTVHTEVYGWNQAPFSSPLNSTSHGKHKL